ncbi:hypothetical protein [Domibacillus tundrae]|uniref:hypothetical protein n=1 Tax=Domibacillus tundrae TaxID=1587527 RepID=UPI00339955FE
MGNQNTIIFTKQQHSPSDVSGSDMYMFRPGRKPLSKKEQQAKDAAFKKRLEEVRERLRAEGKSGGDAVNRS